ncbi:DnaJ domain-containing protein [bacterium]|jgi:molecular chaperone DnaJ|nr:DnaJ domain-containing protein [bacterium]
MDFNKDYYNVLGVDKNSSSSDIKMSYRQLALKYHPDKNNGDKESENRFKHISEAYQILSDKNKKNQYDKQSPYGKDYNPNYANFGFGFDFDDILNQFGFHFGGPGTFGQKNKYEEFKENLDINVNVVISLRDVYKAEPIEIKYKRYVHCDDCDGTGFDRESDSDVCEMCDGSGHNFLQGACEYCRGTGKVFTGTCKKCDGEKVILKDENFNINNIHHVRSSFTEILNGFGHQSKYFRNKKGKVIMSLVYESLPNYDVSKENLLIYNLDVHYQDVIDGNKFEFVLLNDEKIEIEIPKKTKDKDKIILKEKGLCQNAITDKRGDLVFLINVIVDYDKIK